MSMRILLKLFIILSISLSLTACNKFKTYDGPQVTRVVVMKAQRKMFLLHGKKILKEYDVDLGFTPSGHKEIEGDGRTPEGSYFINFHNPNSNYYLSIGISYPNSEDIAYAKKMGKSPGGNIFIHGGPTLKRDKNKIDWTAGCISVSNKQMRGIYAMVEDGTQIDILP